MQAAGSEAWHPRRREASGLPSASVESDHPAVALPIELPARPPAPLLSEAARAVAADGVWALVDQDPESEVIRAIARPPGHLLKSTGAPNLEIISASTARGLGGRPASAASPRGLPTTATG